MTAVRLVKDNFLLRDDCLSMYNYTIEGNNYGQEKKSYSERSL